MSINWDHVTQEAFTSIRRDFTIETLEALVARENDTPVSGDMIAQIRAGVQ
jgi:hypothetical protein